MARWPVVAETAVALVVGVLLCMGMVCLGLLVVGTLEERRVRRSELGRSVDLETPSARGWRMGS